MTDQMAGLPARSCNDPEHNAERMRAAFYAAEPCLVCGAPILNGYGHDEGCALDPSCRVWSMPLPTADVLVVPRAVRP